MTTDNCGRLIKEEEEEEECNAIQMIISKYESEPKQIKREDLIDGDHDLKSERYLEEVKEASHCEVCGGLLGPTDFFSSDHCKFCYQCQNGSNTMDLKPLASDLGSSRFRTQEETIFGKEEDIINENMSNESVHFVQHKISCETEEITEIRSSGNFSNSIRESRIHDENEDQPNDLNERTDVESVENTYTGKMPLHHNICESSLKLHENNNTGEKSFQCKICSRSYTGPTDLKKHEQIHTREKPFQCRICSKSFNQRCTLNKHEKIHTGVKPFQCNICSKSFFFKNKLKTHEKIHTGEKPFQCKICSRSYTDSSNLKKHEKIHTGEKPFRCSICSKSFNHGSNLKKHEKIHTGEKPFQCKICSKSFSHCGYLKRHEKIHTSKRSFQCEICSKSFIRRGDLKRHENIHTGEKPFQCKICSKSFLRKSYLKIHEKIHTGEKLFSEVSV
ncbi:uncharacterized protein [Leptinotarsa decemlineata]|uniref:uncharacterized protein n=1 Tax=Leptinotarsa decemlineata TaxID=7539 RepID=UPI003D308351